MIFHQTNTRNHSASSIQLRRLGLALDDEQVFFLGCFLFTKKYFHLSSPKRIVKNSRRLGIFYRFEPSHWLAEVNL